MKNVTAILLAAGLSKRFGPANKLLVEIDGEAMVRRVAAVVAACKVGRVVVVLGHEADKIESALSGLALETVFNPAFGEGRVSSVRVGVGAVNDDADGFMMCLADQPSLRSADYDALIDAFAEKPDRVLIPFVDGKRGNPVILPIAARDDILGGGVDFGCRDYIDSRPELILRLDVSNPGYRNDIDTPEHLTATRKSL